MRKLFAVAALVVATFLVAPSAALAGGGGYGPIVAPGSVSQGTVGPGGTVTFCGDGFAPNSTVDVTDQGVVVVEDAPTDANGDVCVDLVLTGAGNHVLTMVGEDPDGNPRVVTAAVRVLSSNAAGPVRNNSGSGAGSGSRNNSGSNLARTGAEGTATQVWAGIGLLGLGAGLVALTVSRRKTPPSAA